MKLLGKCWVAFLELYNTFIFSSTSDKSLIQTSFKEEGFQLPSISGGYDSPVFRAPSSSRGSDFQCNYTLFDNGNWVNCSYPDNRGCWLRNRGDPKLVFNISSNYEDPKKVPKGILREYVLDISKKELNQDGVIMQDGVVFNQSYPGPWIQACWGDTVRVKVINGLTKYNGSTVHWHGIRQLNSNQMDGVNGVTQCPIAPGDSFTYEFEALQYGTSWYHSHYSIQYGDGLVGPLTIHGPSSANYDKAIDPILMTDWNHRSAFQDFSKMQFYNSGPPKMDSILLNGTGNFANMFGPSRYNITFEQGKSYLLRLINTAVETTFVFSIDGHNLTVMSSDFVPIKPYETESVTVGIGQRYHVVVHAKKFKEDAKLQNFWIRTTPAEGCSSFERGNIPDERQGILRYAEGKDTRIPRTERNKNVDVLCRDEPYNKLIPILEWHVGKSSKANPTNCMTGSSFDVGMQDALIQEDREKFPHLYGMFGRWAIGDRPLWLDFSNPSIKQLDKDVEAWNKTAVVIPEGCSEDSWIYLLITGNTTQNQAEEGSKRARRLIPAAHPIHLHGHDFALLQQSEQCYEGKVNLTYYNPPRRDVVLLPKNGFVVIAFKADNPGIWLLHCHIAHHASSGLALQILERQKDIKSSAGWLKQVDDGCESWKKWFKPENLWDEDDVELKYFQDDSGI